VPTTLNSASAGMRSKQANKERLSALVQAKCNVTFNPEGLFDVQVKRIHEYISASCSTYCMSSISMTGSSGV